MNLYQALRQELGQARRLMILHYGKPEHKTYQLMCRMIEGELKALTRSDHHMSA